MENMGLKALVALCVLMACVGGLTGKPSGQVNDGDSPTKNVAFSSNIANRLLHRCHIERDWSEIDCMKINMADSVFTPPPGIKKFTVSYASLTSLKNWNFENIKTLWRVSLDGNPLGPSLVQPTSPFIGCVSLKKLYLRKCNITVIHPDFFKGLSALEVLLLAHNQIQRIGADWRLPLGLKVLGLQHNVIQEVRKNWNLSRYQLRELFLENNKITDIEEGSIGLVTLKKLTLSDNRLTTLPIELQKHLTTKMNEKTMSYLNNNPWECDCRLLDIIVQVRNLQDRNFRCGNAGGKPLLDSPLASPLNLRCSPEPPTTAISMDLNQMSDVRNRGMSVVELLRKKQQILVAKKASAEHFHSLSRSLINVDWEIARKVEVLAKKRYEG